MRILSFDCGIQSFSYSLLERRYVMEDDLCGESTEPIDIPGSLNWHVIAAGQPLTIHDVGTTSFAPAKQSLKAAQWLSSMYDYLRRLEDRLSQISASFVVDDPLFHVVVEEQSGFLSANNAAVMAAAYTYFKTRGMPDDRLHILHPSHKLKLKLVEGGDISVFRAKCKNRYESNKQFSAFNGNGLLAAHGYALPKTMKRRERDIFDSMLNGICFVRGQKILT